MHNNWINRWWSQGRRRSDNKKNVREKQIKRQRFRVIKFFFSFPYIYWFFQVACAIFLLLLSALPFIELRCCGKLTYLLLLCSNLNANRTRARPIHCLFSLVHRFGFWKAQSPAFCTLLLHFLNIYTSGHLPVLFSLCLIRSLTTRSSPRKS